MTDLECPWGCRGNEPAEPQNDRDVEVPVAPARYTTRRRARTRVTQADIQAALDLIAALSTPS